MVNSSTAGARNSRQPSGGKQTSGKTKHSRMSTAGKVENMKGMPKGC